MHIPDGFINGATSLGAGVVAISSLGASLRRAGKVLQDRQVPLAGLIAAFIFVLQMLNFPVVSGMIGHLLGGPNHSDRISLAIACASRHIGLALLIAANARGQHALALVVAYLLASAVVSIPYVRWITKHRPPA